MAEELIKISDLDSGTPLNTDYIPYVDGITDTTKKALKSELKGDTGETGDNATVDAGTTTTLSAGESATVTNVGTTSDAIFNFAIPQGIQGLTGADGACVESVSFVGNDMVFVLDDASTITLTNAKTDLKGDTGAKIVSGAFVGDDLVFTLDDNSTATVTGAKTDLQGIQGIQGIQGETGNGISNISLLSTVGLIKTYRITYTDNTTFDYTVTDGANGTGTLSSVVAGTNISIDNTDVNNPVINNTQDISGKEDVSNKKTSLADNSDTFYPTQKAVKTAVDAKQDTLAFTPEDSANKENTTLDTSTTKYPTNRLVKEYADGKVEDNITDGHTTIAPSGNAVFDALAEKASLANPVFTGTVETPAIKITTGAGLGKVLTSDAGGDATWENPSSGSSIKCKYYLDLLQRAKNSQVTKSFYGGSDLKSNLNSELKVSVSASSNDFVQGLFNFSESDFADDWFGEGIVISSHIYVYNKGGAGGKGFTGVVADDIGLGSGTIDFNKKHIGFKLESGNLYATQADGTSESAVLLTSCGPGNFFDLIMVINSSSVDYYYRKKSGALSSVTNISTNKPTTDYRSIYCVGGVNIGGGYTSFTTSGIYIER